MSKFWSWLTSFFHNVLSSFLKQVFTAARAKAIELLKDVAVNAVTKLADTDLSNEEKRKAAFEEIKAYAIAKGIAAGDSVINLAIELAVAVVKG